MSAVSRLGRALRHRNYRLFFAGQGISLVGTWLTRFAMGYATYQLSHSTFQLGLVAFFSQAPTAAIAPVAGVLADRWNRHRALVVTQAAALAQSAALAVSALSGLMTVWHLLVLAAVQAVINAFDMPIRQSFVRRMVDDPADLPNAIALNSSLVNVARLVGPVVAAVLVDVVGIGWCFAIDAASYIAVIASLVAMRVPAQPIRARPGRVRDELVAGIGYVRRHELVRSLLLLFAVTGTFGAAYSAMLPAVAEESFHGGPHALGAMMAAAGAGALVGALYLASRHSAHGLVRLVRLTAFGTGASLVALELATSTATALPMLFVLGLSIIVQWAATNTIVQTVVDEDKLGRVMSLYAVVFFGGQPIGALVEGTLASTLDPVHALSLAGLCCLVGALVFTRSLEEPSRSPRSAA